MNGKSEDELVAGLEAELERLHLREQEVFRDLGHATLDGLTGITSRRELAQIRADMEAGVAALRVLEARRPALDGREESQALYLEERLREEVAR